MFTYIFEVLCIYLFNLVKRGVFTVVSEIPYYKNDRYYYYFVCVGGCACVRACVRVCATCSYSLCVHLVHLCLNPC